MRFNQKKLCCFGVVFFFSVLTSNSYGGNSSSKNRIENTKYINNLKYDLKDLLSVDLRPSQQPLSLERTTSKDEVIICTKKKVDTSSNLDSNALMNPSQGVIYPGAIVQLDSDFALGRPAPYNIARSPIKLRLQLPGIGSDGNFVVNNPTNLSVPAKIDEIIESWFNNPLSKEYQPLVQAYSEGRKAYNAEQISIELGFGAQWNNNSATAALSVHSTSKNTTTYQIFKQVYYSVIAENPQDSGAVFDDNVVLSSDNINSKSPPGFVRSVNYGRLIIVQMTTNENLTKQEAEAAIKFVTSGGVAISANLKQKYQGISENSSFKVILIGGGAGSAMELVDLFTGDATKIPGVIQAGFTFSRENPGFPIEYVVADLKTQRIASISSSTSYVDEQCEILTNRAVRMEHRGGYVAKFIATWKEMDKKNSFVERKYDSGKKTNPWDHTLFFPGDAKDFRFRAINDTGILWDKHHEVEWRLPILTKNECLRITGTTLNMKKSGCKFPGGAKDTGEAR